MTVPSPAPAARLAAWACAVIALLVVAAWPDAYVAAQTAPAQKGSSQKSAKSAASAASPRGEQSIVVLVNDEPITAYEIEQRARLLALSSGAGASDLKAKAEARWAQIVKDPAINARFQELLKQRGVKSREEAQAVQKEFLTGLQKDMIEQLKRESRAAVMPKVKNEAKEELIEERLKVQAAKKLGIEVTDADVKRLLTDVAQRNNMTYDQFSQHLKSAGVEIATMGEKFRAQKAWRDLIGRRYSGQVAVSQRDVDRALSSTAAESGEDGVELQVHKISLSLSAKADRTAQAKRYLEAEGLRRNFGGCKSMGDLAKNTTGAKFEDMRYIKPSAIAEPTRSLLLNAKDGDMLPPLATGSAVDIYAVCGRRAVSGDEAQRAKAMQDLQFKQLDVLARTHMRNLRQEADIEYR